MNKKTHDAVKFFVDLVGGPKEPWLDKLLRLEKRNAKARGQYQQKATKHPKGGKTWSG